MALGRWASAQSVLKVLAAWDALAKNATTKLKIGTVATAVNVHAIPQIGAVLPRSTYLWKVYQFCARGRGIHAAARLALDDREFARLRRECLDANPNRRITFASAKSIERSNFIVFSNGDVVTPAGIGYEKLGNLLSDVQAKERILAIWDSVRYARNAMRTYETSVNME
jgi:hypothetical protein